MPLAGATTLPCARVVAAASGTLPLHALLALLQWCQGRLLALPRQTRNGSAQQQRQEPGPSSPAHRKRRYSRTGKQSLRQLLPQRPQLPGRPPAWPAEGATVPAALPTRTVVAADTPPHPLALPRTTPRRSNPACPASARQSRDRLRRCAPPPSLLLHRRAPETARSPQLRVVLLRHRPSRRRGHPRWPPPKRRAWERPASHVVKGA